MECTVPGNSGNSWYVNYFSGTLSPRLILGGRTSRKIPIPEGPEKLHIKPGYSLRWGSWDSVISRSTFLTGNKSRAPRDFPLNHLIDPCGRTLTLRYF